MQTLSSSCSSSPVSTELLLSDAVHTNQLILEQREQDINHLAIEIEQVSELFSDLAVLVSAQGDVIDNIQTNIENTNHNVERGTRHIVKANKYQMKKRKCYCLVGLFFMIGIVIVILIIISLVN